MKARHQRAKGGKVSEEGKKQEYTPDVNVEKEAKERAKGGRVRADGGKVDGGKSRHRLDRPMRKDGGRVGADKSPFSSARGASAVKEHQTDD